MLIIKKGALLALSLTLALPMAVFLAGGSIMPLNAEERRFTYYGVVPARLWRYNLTDEYDIDSGWRLAYNPGMQWLLEIASWEEAAIRVYNVTYNELIYQGTLGSMKKQYLLLRNGTVFRVESSSPIFVLLSSFGGIPYENETSLPIPCTFYQATDGAYVGKEFIFLVSSDLQRRFTIFALEKSDVTITRGDGGDTRSLKIDPNSFTNILLYPWHIYKIESNGYIMVQSGNPWSYWDYHYSFAIPSVQGGFVGTDFYTVANTLIDEREDCGFRVSALEETSFKVYDLTTKEVLFQSTVEAGGSVRFQVRSNAIKVESSKPVSLIFVHDGDVIQSLGGGTYGSYGAGVIFIGVKANEPTPIYLPLNSTCEAYVFASEETNIEVDGFPARVNVNSPFLITQPGVHRVVSNKNVVVQINHWPKIPENQGLQYPATVIPCVETIHVSHEVNLAPLEEPFPIMYVIAGAAVAVIAAATLLLARRRFRKVSS